MKYNWTLQCIPAKKGKCKQNKKKQKKAKKGKITFWSPKFDRPCKFLLIDF